MINRTTVVLSLTAASNSCKATRVEAYWTEENSTLFKAAQLFEASMREPPSSFGMFVPGFQKQGWWFFLFKFRKTKFMINYLISIYLSIYLSADTRSWVHHHHFAVILCLPHILTLSPISFFFYVSLFYCWSCFLACVKKQEGMSSRTRNCSLKVISRTMMSDE